MDENLVKPVRATGRFARDVKRLRRKLPAHEFELESIAYVAELLAEGGRPDPALGMHLLDGEWGGYHAINLSGDWRLIVRVLPDEIVLHATGTHADVYRSGRRRKKS